MENEFVEFSNIICKEISSLRKSIEKIESKILVLSDKLYSLSKLVHKIPWVTEEDSKIEAEELNQAKDHEIKRVLIEKMGQDCFLPDEFLTCHNQGGICETYIVNTSALSTINIDRLFELYTKYKK